MNKEIFYIVNQLNSGVSYVKEKSDKRNLAELNLKAGKKAIASNAYDSALKYLMTGIDLLEKDSWKQNYNFTLSLFQETAVAAQLSGNYDKIDIFADEVFNNAKTILDKIPVYEAKIFACISRNQLREGVEIGLEALQELGLKLPGNPGKLRTVFELLYTKISVAGKPVDNLINLPEADDPQKLATMQILSDIALPAFLGVPEFFPLTIFNMVRLSVKYGNSIYSPYFYAGFGMIHCSIFGDINQGYKYGTLAVDLIEKFNVKETKSRVLFVAWYILKHWKLPLRETTAPLLDAYKIGLDTGDLEFSTLSVACYTAQLFASGINLEEVEHEVSKYIETLKKHNQDTNLNYHLMRHQIVLNLQGKSENPCKLSGSAYDEDEMMPVHEKANDRNAFFVGYCYLLNLNYLFENTENALKYSELVKPYCATQISHPLLPVINFYDSLTRLKLFPTLEQKEKKKFRKIIEKNQKTLKKWASHSPENYSHKYHLVEAEIACVEGDEIAARENYKLAVKLARENKFLNEEALALELTAKFWLKQNEEKTAALYMAEASNTYYKWGAHAKVKHFEDNYHSLLKLSGDFVKLDIGETLSISDRNKISNNIDLSSIMKSANAFAGTLNRKDLLRKLIEIAIKNAGATNGCLLLKKGNEYYIEVEQDDKGEITVMHSRFLADVPNIAISVINYVIHTKKYIVLDNAAIKGDFTLDPWIKESQVKSLLVSALIHHSEIVGILYAENNIVTGAFTEDRLATLRMLSTQAAISLENAQFFENIKRAENEVRELNVSLERKVVERTDALNQSLKEVEEANSHIMSSIRYSSMIQHSLLPATSMVEKIIPESFIIWQPRDIISGDIYYVEQLGKNFIVAVIDCTGHGVPGAFMTMIASTGLRRIVNEEADYSPGSILKKLNYIVKTSLQQDKEHSKSDDGLDAGICAYNSKSDELVFSGAKLSLFYTDNDELKIIKGDKESIGYVSSNLDYKFKEYVIENASTRCFYMTSDGYTDQLGGEQNRRFSTKKFKNLILDNHKKPFKTQMENFNSTFDKHLGENERTDDVTLTGFKPQVK